jgi:predicted amidohydrolase
VNIAIVQPDIVWEDPPQNYARVRELLGATRLAPGSLVILPELFACGFSMCVERVAESRPRPTETYLAELARQRQFHVLGGVAAEHGGDVRNEAVFYDPSGTNVARYAKLHPFAPGGEAAAYARGHDIVTFDCMEFRIAPFICYDLRFPEIFRRATRRGANLLAVIANWPSSRVEHWLTLLRARAIENQAYVVGVNRCGNDPNLTYPGRSIIVEPLGEIVADAGASETVLQAEIDIRKVKDFRAKLPFLRDMRDEFLGL